MSSADELAHALGGIIHHRDHPCIIEPRRADHAENADDAAGALAVRRDDGGGAREREQLVLRADKDMGALGALGPPDEIDPPALGLEIIEQTPHPLHTLHYRDLLHQA